MAQVERKAGYALAYAALIPALQECARPLGYAVCVHGSMIRDLDVVAVPWTEEAADAETLAEALREAIGGLFGTMMNLQCFDTVAHGRMRWTIHSDQFGVRNYVDLSVMPRLSSESGP